MPMMNQKPNQQCRENQEPTVTAKSSGIDYVHSQLEPRQPVAAAPQPVTENDKG